MKHHYEIEYRLNRRWVVLDGVDTNIKKVRREVRDIAKSGKHARIVKVTREVVG